MPGSVVEFLNVIGPLTDPRVHGADPADAFDLVIPSLPGFAFSAPLTGRGWSTQRTAAAWAALMDRLGYQRYGAAGNDAGSMISPEVGRIDPEHVVGVHVTQVFSFPSGDPAEFEGMSAEDHDAAIRPATPDPARHAGPGAQWCHACLRPAARRAPPAAMWS